MFYSLQGVIISFVYWVFNICSVVSFVLIFKPCPLDSFSIGFSTVCRSSKLSVICHYGDVMGVSNVIKDLFDNSFIWNLIIHLHSSGLIILKVFKQSDIYVKTKSIGTVICVVLYQRHSQVLWSIFKHFHRNLYSAVIISACKIALRANKFCLNLSLLLNFAMIWMFPVLKTLYSLAWPQFEIQDTRYMGIEVWMRHGERNTASDKWYWRFLRTWTKVDCSLTRLCVVLMSVLELVKLLQIQQEYLMCIVEQITNCIIVLLKFIRHNAVTSYRSWANYWWILGNAWNWTLRNIIFEG